MGYDSDGRRYLKVKFILVRDTTTGVSSTKTEAGYNAPRYDVYEIDYLHGYNRGDARFENIVPGTYYLRIKTEKIDRPSQFVVNYASNNKIIME